LPERRVVITGMGVISPIGLNKEEFWSSLLAGCSGIKEIDRFPTDNFPTKIAAQVKDFQIVDYVSRRDARRMDLFVQFACAAARIAVEDAALTINDENRTRTGVWIASGIGGGFSRDCLLPFFGQVGYFFICLRTYGREAIGKYGRN
jgi:3-oxoacyl-[acyl-carrier-protein] synthase II